MSYLLIFLASLSMANKLETPTLKNYSHFLGRMLNALNTPAKRTRMKVTELSFFTAPVGAFLPVSALVLTLRWGYLRWLWSRGSNRYL